LGTAKGIYVGGTLLSDLISLYLFISGRRESGIFVGLWAPPSLKWARPSSRTTNRLVGYALC
jgi:hypothetical protein